VVSRFGARQVDRFRRRWATRERLLPWDRAAWVLALLSLVLPAFVMLWPWLRDSEQYGFHDWDVMTSHRHLAVTSLRQYGELPAWNPYACGGFPAWGYIEGGTNVVSPWLPLYWWLDIRRAVRLEVLGMALVGAWGCYLAAGTLTSSRGARAMAVALWAANGRFGLQAAAGHGWHLAYAILPWAFWCFERARTKPVSIAHSGGLALSFAMLVYSGGIYPLPHTVLLLGLWALCVAAIDRSFRPVLVLAATGGAGALLSAPKLLPMLALFERAPRTIDSTEVLSLRAFVTLLTSREQGFFDRPATVSPYGWHEWGMYISLPGALLLAAALVLTRGKREAALKGIGVLFCVLGFGAFHRWAPWSLLHQLPMFQSQHVPSRFLYPAAFAVSLVLAAGLGALVLHAKQKRPYLDAVLAAFALALALDVASVAQKPMKQSMTLRAPEAIRAAPAFVTETKAPLQYAPRDWAAPMYLAMRANTGVLECYGAPPFSERGAIARSDRRYHGEAFVLGSGNANIRAWTPNRAEIELKEVRAGSRLIYNTNFDGGWQAMVENDSGEHRVRPIALDNRVAVELPQGDSVVVLRYRPPGFGIGVVLASLTALGFAFALAFRRQLMADERALP